MELAEIHDANSLEAYLKEKTGYCRCGAGENGIRLLRDVLEAARDRAAALNDRESFRRATERIVSSLKLDGDQALGGWFLHSLERAGLIYHDKNITDIWPESEGTALLETIDKYFPKT
jgi:hypothetical protein